jgi:hypothetical protein
VNLVDDKISTKSNVVKAKNSSGSEIPTATKVAITLRWLAGGSYIDICFAFGIAPGTFYHDNGVLWGTMKIIDTLFNIHFPFTDHHQLRQMANGFSSFSYNRLTDCCLAINGWVMRTRQPYSWEVTYPSHYYNRHDCFGLVILGNLIPLSH